MGLLKQRTACGILFLLLILGVLCAFLVSCRGEAQRNGIECAVDYNQYAQGNGFFSYTDTAFLFFAPRTPIQFIDTELTQQPEVMCAKPNCQHNSVDCSAYVDTTGLYAYNNQLYYVSKGTDGNVGLYQMEFGGGKRRLVFGIDEINELESYGFTYRIASGYFLLDLQRDDAFQSIDTLYLYPLKADKTAPITIYEEFGGEELVQFWVRNDWVFYTVARDANTKQQYLYGYQISTQQTTLLYEDWRSQNGLCLKGETLYFSKEAETLCGLNLESGKVTEFPNRLEQVGENYNVIYDDAYCYLTSGDSANSFGKAGVFIYTYQGELVQFVPFEGDRILAYCISGPDVVLFYDVMSAENTPVCYLTKADIAKEEANFIFLEEAEHG